jgi:hypothetical protein
MATIKKAMKKPIKKAQKGLAVDKTKVVKNFSKPVDKESKFRKMVKDTRDIKSNLNKPYTTVAIPDREGLPGDSIRYYTGKRGSLGTPYTRDIGLKGIAQVPFKDMVDVSRDKKRSRTYQDTTRAKVNFEQKNGGSIKKAKSGGSFPDLNKDGKITKADILKGRGVIAKKGAKVKAVGMKKCKYGCK